MLAHLKSTIANGFRVAAGILLDTADLMEDKTAGRRHNPDDCVHEWDHAMLCKHCCVPVEYHQDQLMNA